MLDDVAQGLTFSGVVWPDEDHNSGRRYLNLGSAA